MPRATWLAVFSAVVLLSAVTCSKSVEPPPLPPSDAGGPAERNIIDTVPPFEAPGPFDTAPKPENGADVADAGGSDVVTDYLAPDVPTEKMGVTCDLFKQDCPKPFEACFPDELLTGGTVCATYLGLMDPKSFCSAHTDCNKGYMCMLTSSGDPSRHCTKICASSGSCPLGFTCTALTAYKDMGAGYCYGTP